MGLFSSLFKVFQKDPKLERTRFELDPALASYYKSRSAGLSEDYDRDRGFLRDMMESYNKTLPDVDMGYDQAVDFVSQLAPGGKQERRFSDLIRDSFSKQRQAHRIGLDKARAESKRMSALAGVSPFADSKYARAQEQLKQTNFETGLSAAESDAQIANSRGFLSSYNPSALMKLGAARTQYAGAPLSFVNQFDQVSNQRASGVGAGLRNSFDDHYNFKQPKNWATYAQAGMDTIGDVARLGAGIYDMKDAFSQRFGGKQS